MRDLRGLGSAVPPAIEAPPLLLSLTSSGTSIMLAWSSFDPSPDVSWGLFSSVSQRTDSCDSPSSVCCVVIFAELDEHRRSGEISGEMMPLSMSK